MNQWKKSRLIKGFLSIVLFLSIIVDVIGCMYILVGKQYSNIDVDKSKDFFVRQEDTKQLLDGYIRLFEEYMHIGSLITTDGDIDYDKEILVSVSGGKNYTIKELLKNSTTNGNASKMLRDFMTDFSSNSLKGKSYPWITRHITRFESRVTIADSDVYVFQSPNAIALTQEKIKNMLRFRKNMIPVKTSDIDNQEKYKDNIDFLLPELNNYKIKFASQSVYEQYIITYFPKYAKKYYLRELMDSYLKKNNTFFDKEYNAYVKSEQKKISKENFYKKLEKALNNAKADLNYADKPWKPHVIPRSMSEAKKYVTFLVETYQQMKYLFSNTNFVFAYENSNNMLITNNDKLWNRIKFDAVHAQKREKVTDSSLFMYAYFNSKEVDGVTNMRDDSFQMSGNIFEKLKDIGSDYRMGICQIGVGLDLNGIRSHRVEDVFEKLYKESMQKYEMYQNGKEYIVYGSIFGIFSFLLLIVMCGNKKREKTLDLFWFDRVWLEVQILFGYIFLKMAYWLLELWNGVIIKEVLYLYGVLISILIFLCIEIILSVIKRRKLRCQIQYSVILLFINQVIIKKMKVREWTSMLGKRVAMLPPKAKYSFTILFEGVIAIYYVFCMILIKLDAKMTVTSFFYTSLGWIAIFMGIVFLCFILKWQKNAIKSEETEMKIIEGTKKILEGDLEYQIQNLYTTGYREQELIDTINHIGIVLEKAVEESVRSERMKTELIANVSHDIKTPLTSVINYVDLIKREHVTDEKIQKYIDVLERKSLRLKTLIEDLVEASKASSGVIELDINTLNFNELIRQTNGEFEDRYEECHLEIISDIPEKSMYFRGDGRRVFRILENIYNNAAKYAMPATRVYISLKQEEDSIIFSMKNISATKLNITPEELTERFVRGDRSRTTEGSGLGLSIAKSLTELMGGKFSIELDGDLFCAKIAFPEVKDNEKI